MANTVGSEARKRLLQKKETRDPIEIEREMHKNFEEQIIKCIDIHQKFFPDDFYIIVITKQEKLMQNVLRSYFFGRLSCPTPEWDQTVYKYIRKDDTLEYLWTVPDRQTCVAMKDAALEVPEEERWLLQMVLDYDDGTLMNKARRLNNEIND
jgi:hypothetical protein